MSLTIILKAIELGLIFSILSLGVYISFRVLNVPDLTVDGSFATGCAVCAVIDDFRSSLSWFIVGVCSGWLMWNGNSISSNQNAYAAFIGWHIDYGCSLFD